MSDLKGLEWDDIRKLSKDELTELRCKLVNNITEMKAKIVTSHQRGRETHSIKAACYHTERTVSMVTRHIKSINTAEHEHRESKAKKKDVYIEHLKEEIKQLKKEIQKLTPEDIKE